MTSAITTHVLDISRGHPAIGVAVSLEIRTRDGWKSLGNGLTDEAGRCNTLQLENTLLAVGTYRIIFNAGAYYHAQHTETFYGEIPVVFEVRHPEAHYHVPLLLSPYGYSTYRGS